MSLGKIVTLPNGQRVHVCHICNGSGECYSCDGHGREKALSIVGPHIGAKCTSCKGTGKCYLCKGVGAFPA